MKRRLIISILSFLVYIPLYVWITTYVPQLGGEELFKNIFFSAASVIVAMAAQAFILIDCMTEEDMTSIAAPITALFVCVGAFIIYLNLGFEAAATLFIPYAYLWILGIINIWLQSRENTVRRNIYIKEDQERRQQQQRAVDDFVRGRTLIDGCDVQVYGKVSAIQELVDRKGVTLTVQGAGTEPYATTNAREALERAMVESTKVTVRNDYITASSQMHIVHVVVTGMGVTVAKYFNGRLLEL